MRIAFLITTAYGMGGTIRTTLNVAAHLADSHEVEVISVNRHRDNPFFPVDPRIKMTWIMDTRSSAAPRWFGSLLADTPSLLTHRYDRARQAYNLRSDLPMLRRLRSLRADVLITTRPALNLLAARYVSRKVITIGQEHLHFGAHKPQLHASIRRAYPHLDALVTLTEADRADYARMLTGSRTLVRTISNALPPGAAPRSRQENRIVATAGRFVSSKAYERLIEAFARVVEKRPDWRLRIYGSGQDEDKLRRLVFERQLHNHVHFMGRTSDVEGEFAKASLGAISSRFEGFGMTIIEAFAAGLPVVSFDCPQGPPEIITSGHDGFLVPEGGDEIESYAHALLALIEDGDLRRRMGRNALESSERYSIGAIGGKWDALIAELTASRLS